ncbi:MAG TPA: helix-turn-helix domain-containing protein [Chloroflexota bacterium]|nr:helix-turn-helix domain-containing protein [Chloroflexota bacterium]
MDDQVGGEGVSVAEAMQILGVSEKTIRRRIQQGKLAAIRLDRPQGHEWRVVIDQDMTKTPAAPGQYTERRGQVRDQDTDQVDPVTADQLTLSLRLSETLARQLEDERARTAAAIADRDDQVGDRDRRIAELEQTRFELGALVSSFQTQLAIANDRILLLESPKPESVPIEPAVSVVESRRRWWWPFGR